jgi:hypothetical protein
MGNASRAHWLSFEEGFGFTFGAVQLPSLNPNLKPLLQVKQTFWTVPCEKL